MSVSFHQLEQMYHLLTDADHAEGYACVRAEGTRVRSVCLLLNFLVNLKAL